MRSKPYSWNEVSEPRYGFRERFKKCVQTKGRYAFFTGSSANAYGHVVLDIEPDPILEEVVFESRVDEATIPEEYIPSIASAVRETVFRGGPSGYPLSGFRVTVVGEVFTR